jgi:hypothetical protein
MASCIGYSESEKEILEDGLIALAVPMEALSVATEGVARSKAALKASSAASSEDVRAQSANFREKASTYKGAEAAARAAVQELASKTRLNPAAVLKKFKTHMEKKDLDRIKGIIMASQSVDLCFVLDATYSMDPFIGGVLSTVREIIGELQGMMKYLKYRLGCVVYRDVGDAKRFEVHKFSGSISALEGFLANIVATGGDDACEDVLGGLAEASAFDWKYHNKILILCADAPCHGVDFHDGCGDRFPDGVFEGSRNAAPVLQGLRQQDVNFTFLKINHSTDKMVQKFDELGGGGWISTAELTGLDLHNPKNLTKALTESIKASVKGSVVGATSASQAAADKKLSKKATFKRAAVDRLAVLEQGDGRSAAEDSGSD